MTLKEFIESHPLPVLIGVILATASASTGVATYGASAKFDSDKSKLEVEYKNEISTLKSRLASIERRLGSDEKTYFDISQLVITSDQVKRLDPAYMTASGGDFFYVLPAGHPWKYDFISERELYAMKLGDFSKDADVVKLLAPFGEKTIHLWRGTPVTTVLPRARKGLDDVAPKSLKFFPMVAIQVLNPAQMNKLIGTVLHSDDEESDVQALSAQVEESLSKIRAATPSAPAAAASSPPLASAPAQGTASLPAESVASHRSDGQSKLETEELLGKIFRGDMAIVMLGGLIKVSFLMPQLLQGAEWKLNSIQKKGNVLYVQMTIKFDSIAVAGGKQPISLTVDRELFIVTNSKNFYIVQVEVPSTDGRSDAYPWVGQWLSGVRIPI